MANPFLFMEDDSAGVDFEVNNDAFSNPFLVDDDAQEEFTGDNPFFSGANNPFSFSETDTDGNQVATTTAANYFSATDTVTQADTSLFLTEDANSNEHHIDHTMAFFGTTINEHDGLQADTNIHNQHNAFLAEDPTNVYSSEDELKMKHAPPRPNPPPSQVTQLISNLTDHLDQTSTHLLGRLPKTRTPSPVNMRDFQSPSPTPDNIVDLLDVSEQQSNITATNQPQGGFFDMQDNDNMFMPVAPVATTIANEIVTDPFAASIQTMTQTQEQKPARPPPSRPIPPRPIPPRPTPPKGSLKSSPVTAPTPVHPMNTATVAQSQIQQDQDQDLFDFFGTAAKKPPPKPPAPKSKEDILSLFSAPPPTVQPVVNQQPDFLSDDFDFAMAPAVTENTTVAPAPVEAPVLANVVETITSPPLISQDVVNPPLEESFVEPIIEETKAVEVETQAVEPKIVEKEPEFDETNMIIRPDIPQIEETLVKSLPPSDDENSPGVQSPTESYNVTSSGQPDSTSGSILNMHEEIEEPEPFESIPATQNVADQYIYSPEIDYAPQSADVANPFAIEEPEPVIATNAPVNVFAEPVQQQPAPVQEPTVQYNVQPIVNDIFGTAVQQEQPQKPKPPPPPVRSYQTSQHVAPAPAPVPAPVAAPVVQQADDFDDFSAKFDSKVQPKVTGNAFLDSFAVTSTTNDAWGDSTSGGFGADGTDGFGNEDDGFDAWNPPPAAPGSTPFDRRDSDEDNKEFNVFIRPKEADMSYGAAAPVLAPPPQRSPHSGSVYSGDSSPRVNPFDSKYEEETAEKLPGLERSGSQDSGPPTPLFDEDVSQPLEDFPRIFYSGDGWEMQLRQPNKKKITGQRFWKKIWVRLVYQGDNPVIQLSNSATDKDPFQELPLQACYSVSEIGAQQYDNFGKIFTIKLQYVFYKERPGVRPGQVTKAERLTNKLSQFAAYAIQGDYQGVKEFGSDLKKLGLPVEHAPQISQLFKLGSMNYEDVKQFSMCIEEALFKLNVHRDRALTYKMEEVQITCVDELYAEQNADGAVTKQIARVRLFFLGFLSGMPDIEVGVNDLWRQGKEVVGRHDIIPVVTEEWIRLEGVEFHACVQQDEYERTRTIKLKPPDACYIELMRFRVRPPKNRELPLQLKAQWVVTGNKVQLRADVLVPGFASRKLGQIPCEDVSIRFPIPECWIYLFRVEKHFRYGSVKSTHRRTGKIKGIERLLGTMETLQESLIEVTSGQAKYEHHHRAIVWRCPRLPKEGQGAYTTHQLVCRLALTSFDQIPEQLAPYAYVEFTMPATTVSHTTVRSVSVQDSESDEPPEKYVRHLARIEYRVGIEHTQGDSLNPYLAATTVAPKLNQIEEQPMATTPTAPSDSDSDSN